MGLPVVTNRTIQLAKSRCLASLVFWVGLVILCSQTDGVASTNQQTVVASAPISKRASPKFQGIKQKPVNYREPLREYETVCTNGWTIEVEKQLMTDEPDLGRKAAARLGQKLSEAVALLPEASRENLRKHKIFLMYGPKAKNDGRDNGAEYYQRHAPACYPHLDTRWGGSIVVYCAANYVWQTEFWALKLMLHELAHSYHLEKWPEDQPDICRAYENAMNRKLYRDVRDSRGKMHEKAYAIQNPIEYFGELSCMYFAGCDYPPRNRKELKEYDPEGYAMIQKLWGVTD